MTDVHNGRPGTTKEVPDVSASSSFDIVGVHRGDSVAALDSRSYGSLNLHSQPIWHGIVLSEPLGI
jgi:hypothetical protein